MTEPALAVHQVGFRFGDRVALEEVSFLAQRGRFTALLGPNGAGKTTLFALLTGLLRAPSGTIRLLGHDMARAPRAALARLGVVFQQPTLDLDLTVAQNLRHFASLHGLTRRQAEPRIERQLARLDMAERAAERVRDLNGGHRRRVEIARALLHAPELLLLDEATVGLDLPTRRRLIEHVHALCRDEGLAVLWATHLIDEIDPVFDDVVVLHRGRVRAWGGAPELLRATRSASLGQVFDALTGAA
jgi:ABC-2 type transport system ATP-binding protein